MSKDAGERLKKARKAKFASAADAARHFGLAPSTYRAHENGQNAFDVDQCITYAEFFGVSAPWLAWGMSDQPNASATIEARLPSWLAGIVEGLRPDASPEAVAVIVQAALELLRTRKSLARSASDPAQMRLLARYEAGKLGDK